MQLQLDNCTTAKVARFFALRLCCLVTAWCAHLDGRCHQSSLESGKLTTTNYLSPSKLHLYYKIDGDPSEILRTSASKLCNLGPGIDLLRTACIFDNDVLVWPLIFATVTCLHVCSQIIMVNSSIQCAYGGGGGGCNHHRGISYICPRSHGGTSPEIPLIYMVTEPERLTKEKLQNTPLLFISHYLVHL